MPRFSDQLELRVVPIASRSESDSRGFESSFKSVNVGKEKCTVHDRRAALELITDDHILLS